MFELRTVFVCVSLAFTVLHQKSYGKEAPYRGCSREVLEECFFSFVRTSVELAWGIDEQDDHCSTAAKTQKCVKDELENCRRHIGNLTLSIMGHFLDALNYVTDASCIYGTGVPSCSVEVPALCLISFAAVLGHGSFVQICRQVELSMACLSSVEDMGCPHFRRNLISMVTIQIEMMKDTICKPETCNVNVANQCLNDALRTLSQPVTIIQQSPLVTRSVMASLLCAYNSTWSCKADAIPSHTSQKFSYVYNFLMGYTLNDDKELMLGENLHDMQGILYLGVMSANMWTTKQNLCSLYNSVISAASAKSYHSQYIQQLYSLNDAILEEYCNGNQVLDCQGSSCSLSMTPCEVERALYLCAPPNPLHDICLLEANMLQCFSYYTSGCLAVQIAPVQFYLDWLFRSCNSTFDLMALDSTFGLAQCALKLGQHLEKNLYSAKEFNPVLCEGLHNFEECLDNRSVSDMIKVYLPQYMNFQNYYVNNKCNINQTQSGNNILDIDETEDCDIDRASMTVAYYSQRLLTSTLAPRSEYLQICRDSRLYEEQIKKALSSCSHQRQAMFSDAILFFSYLNQHYCLAALIMADNSDCNIQGSQLCLEDFAGYLSLASVQEANQTCMKLDQMLHCLYMNSWNCSSDVQKSIEQELDEIYSYLGDAHCPRFDWCDTAERNGSMMAKFCRESSKCSLSLEMCFSSSLADTCLNTSVVRSCIHSKLSQCSCLHLALMLPQIYMYSSLLNSTGQKLGMSCDIVPQLPVNISDCPNSILQCLTHLYDVQMITHQGLCSGIGDYVRCLQSGIYASTNLSSVWYGILARFTWLWEKNWYLDCKSAVLFSEDTQHFLVMDEPVITINGTCDTYVTEQCLNQYARSILMIPFYPLSDRRPEDCQSLAALHDCVIDSTGGCEPVDSQPILNSLQWLSEKFDNMGTCSKSRMNRHCRPWEAMECLAVFGQTLTSLKYSHDVICSQVQVTELCVETALSGCPGDIRLQVEGTFSDVAAIVSHVCLSKATISPEIETDCISDHGEQACDLEAAMMCMVPVQSRLLMYYQSAWQDVCGNVSSMKICVYRNTVGCDAHAVQTVSQLLTRLELHLEGQCPQFYCDACAARDCMAVLRHGSLDNICLGLSEAQHCIWKYTQHCDISVSDTLLNQLYNMVGRTAESCHLDLNSCLQDFRLSAFSILSYRTTIFNMTIQPDSIHLPPLDDLCDTASNAAQCIYNYAITSKEEAGPLVAAAVHNISSFLGFLCSSSLPHQEHECFRCMETESDMECNIQPLELCSSENQVCGTVVQNGLISKGCMNVGSCRYGCLGDSCAYCCHGNLCNQHAAYPLEDTPSCQPEQTVSCGMHLISVLSRDASVNHCSVLYEAASCITSATSGCVSEAPQILAQLGHTLLTSGQMFSCQTQGTQCQCGQCTSLMLLNTVTNTYMDMDTFCISVQSLYKQTMREIHNSQCTGQQLQTVMFNLHLTWSMLGDTCHDNILPPIAKEYSNSSGSGVCDFEKVHSCYDFAALSYMVPMASVIGAEMICYTAREMIACFHDNIQGCDAALKAELHGHLVSSLFVVQQICHNDPLLLNILSSNYLNQSDNTGQSQGESSSCSVAMGYQCLERISATKDACQLAQLMIECVQNHTSGCVSIQRISHMFALHNHIQPFIFACNLTVPQETHDLLYPMAQCLTDFANNITAIMVEQYLPQGDKSGLCSNIEDLQLCLYSLKLPPAGRLYLLHIKHSLAMFGQMCSTTGSDEVLFSCQHCLSSVDNMDCNLEMDEVCGYYQKACYSMVEIDPTTNTPWIAKGCVNPSMCQADYGCSEDGTSCRICCNTPGCNTELPDSWLSLWSNHTVTPIGGLTISPEANSQTTTPPRQVTSRIPSILSHSQVLQNGSTTVTPDESCQLELIASQSVSSFLILMMDVSYMMVQDAISMCQIIGNSINSLVANVTQNCSDPTTSHLVSITTMLNNLAQSVCPVPDMHLNDMCLSSATCVSPIIMSASLRYSKPMCRSFQESIECVKIHSQDCPKFMQTSLYKTQMFLEYMKESICMRHEINMTVISIPDCVDLQVPRGQGQCDLDKVNQCLYWIEQEALNPLIHIQEFCGYMYLKFALQCFIDNTIGCHSEAVTPIYTRINKFLNKVSDRCPDLLCPLHTEQCVIGATEDCWTDLNQTLSLGEWTDHTEEMCRKMSEARVCLLEVTANCSRQQVVLVMHHFDHMTDDLQHQCYHSNSDLDPCLKSFHQNFVTLMTFDEEFARYVYEQYGDSGFMEHNLLYNISMLWNNTEKNPTQYAITRHYYDHLKSLCLAIQQAQQCVITGHYQMPVVQRYRILTSMDALVNVIEHKCQAQRYCHSCVGLDNDDDCRRQPPVVCDTHQVCYLSVKDGLIYSGCEASWNCLHHCAANPDNCYCCDDSFCNRESKVTAHDECDVPAAVRCAVHVFSYFIGISLDTKGAYLHGNISCIIQQTTDCNSSEEISLHILGHKLQALESASSNCMGNHSNQPCQFPVFSLAYMMQNGHSPEDICWQLNATLEVYLAVRKSTWYREEEVILMTRSMKLVRLQLLGLCPDLNGLDENFQSISLEKIRTRPYGMGMEGYSQLIKTCLHQQVNETHLQKCNMILETYTHDPADKKLFQCLLVITQAVPVMLASVTFDSDICDLLNRTQLCLTDAEAELYPLAKFYLPIVLMRFNHSISNFCHGEEDKLDGYECLQSAPPGNCPVNPCDSVNVTQHCPMFPEAVCQPNYCGGCNINFIYREQNVTDLCSEANFHSCETVAIAENLTFYFTSVFTWPFMSLMERQKFCRAHQELKIIQEQISLCPLLYQSHVSSLLKWIHFQREDICITQVDLKTTECDEDRATRCLEDLLPYIGSLPMEDASLCRTLNQSITCLQDSLHLCQTAVLDRMRSSLAIVQTSVGHLCPEVSQFLPCQNWETLADSNGMFFCDSMVAMACLGLVETTNLCIDSLAVEVLADCVLKNTLNCEHSYLENIYKEYNQTLTQSGLSCADNILTRLFPDLYTEENCTLPGKCSVTKAYDCVYLLNGTVGTCGNLDIIVDCIDFHTSGCSDMQKYPVVFYLQHHFITSKFGVTCLKGFNEEINKDPMVSILQCVQQMTEQFENGYQLCKAFETLGSCLSNTTSTEGAPGIWHQLLLRMTDNMEEFQTACHFIESWHDDIPVNPYAEDCDATLIEIQMGYFQAMMIRNIFLVSMATSDKDLICQLINKELSQVDIPLISGCPQQTRKQFLNLHTLLNILVVTSSTCTPPSVQCHHQSALHCISHLAQAVTYYDTFFSRHDICRAVMEAESCMRDNVQHCDHKQTQLIMQAYQPIRCQAINICPMALDLYDHLKPTRLPTCLSLASLGDETCDLYRGLQCLRLFDLEGNVSDDIELCSQYAKASECFYNYLHHCEENNTLQLVHKMFLHKTEKLRPVCHLQVKPSCNMEYQNCKTDPADACIAILMHIISSERNSEDICLSAAFTSTCLEKNILHCPPILQYRYLSLIQYEMEKHHLNCSSNLHLCSESLIKYSKNLITHKIEMDEKYQHDTNGLDHDVNEENIDSSEHEICEALNQTYSCLEHEMLRLDSDLQSSMMAVVHAVRNSVHDICMGQEPGYCPFELYLNVKCYRCCLLELQKVEHIFNTVMMLTDSSNGHDTTRENFCSTYKSVQTVIMTVEDECWLSQELLQLWNKTIELYRGKQCILDPCSKEAAQICFNKYGAEVTNITAVDVCSAKEAASECLMTSLLDCDPQILTELISELHSLNTDREPNCRLMPYVPVSSRHVDIVEGNSPAHLNFTVMTPYKQSCRSNSCMLEIQFVFSQNTSTLPRCSNSNGIQQVVSSTCSHVFSKDTWIKPLDMYLEARVDHRMDRMQEVHITPVATLWENGTKILSWHLLSIQIAVEDQDTRSFCFTAGTNYISSFDGRLFENVYRGEFTLYQHTDYPYAVHVIYQPCANGYSSCACAAMVMIGDDVITVDYCRKIQDSKVLDPVLDVKVHQNGELTPGTRVFRNVDGKVFQLVLPHGTLVTIMARNTVVVWIKPSPYDLQKTEGLCGSYIGDRPNEDISQSIKQQGTSQVDQSTISEHEFLQQWRSTNSIMKGVEAQCMTERDDASICQCGSETRERVCSQFALTEICDLVIGKEITDNLESYHVLDNAQQTRRKRQTVKTQNDIWLGDGDTSQNISWPTPSGWNETAAKLYCEDALVDSRLGQICGRVITPDIEILFCISDIKNTDSLDMVILAVDAYRYRCKLSVLLDPTLRVYNMTHEVLLQQIDSVSCPEDCNGQGTCGQGVCSCYDGYVGSACSVKTSVAPQIIELRENYLQSSTTEYNKTMYIQGSGFVDLDSLTCHFQTLEVSTSGYTRTNNYTTSPANLQTNNILSCDLNGYLPLHAVLVSVSNDRRLHSNELLHIAYSPICYSCDLTSGSCDLQPTICMLDGVCYAPGQFNPNSPCELCDPISNLWRYKPSDTCPVSNTTTSITATSRHDNSTPQPDTTTPKFNMTTSKPDTTTTSLNNTTPKLDTTFSKLNTIAPESNTTTPKLSTTLTTFNTITPKSNTTNPKSDTTIAKSNTTTSKPDTTIAKSNTTTSKPDTTIAKPNTTGSRLEVTTTYKTSTTAPKPYTTPEGNATPQQDKTTPVKTTASPGSNDKNTQGQNSNQEQQQSDSRNLIIVIIVAAVVVAIVIIVAIAVVCWLRNRESRRQERNDVAGHENSALDAIEEDNHNPLKQELHLPHNTKSTVSAASSATYLSEILTGTRWGPPASHQMQGQFDGELVYDNPAYYAVEIAQERQDSDTYVKENDDDGFYAILKDENQGDIAHAMTMMESAISDGESSTESHPLEAGQYVAPYLSPEKCDDFGDDDVPEEVTKL
ncbi:hypothetical protein CHS0354_020848 [Potamilus streckersoni]|uniref:VWFD domain-containing protein n=1 Tax=Potamilus streckersoni TaxID=2493646 RepID=A0AAE0W8S1_9BIVA|nr:hypothetical protein CHS0354_020848 [Potamilus streckersoni]